MIRAIIFDCFGVLTTDGWLNFASNSITDPKKQQQAHDLNKQANVGLITYDEFVNQIALLAAISSKEAHEMLDNHSPNRVLFDQIESLKKMYKIGMLSNASENWLEVLFSKKQIQLFDAVVLSYEVGVSKPHPKAYHAICDRLGVDPTETVFIDDIERYVTGAQDIGMRGIWFKNNQQFTQELAQLLTDSNS